LETIVCGSAVLVVQRNHAVTVIGKASKAALWPTLAELFVPLNRSAVPGSAEAEPAASAKQIKSTHRMNIFSMVQKKQPFYHE
jgi:hypothetical protein